MNKGRTALRISLIVLMVIYLAGPVIAAAFSYPDRRGPRIYPRTYHSFVFRFAYGIFHGGEKPRLPYDRDRAWFYGMERPEKPGFRSLQSTDR